jgi:hypothetical protein
MNGNVGWPLRIGESLGEPRPGRDIGGDHERSRTFTAAGYVLVSDRVETVYRSFDIAEYEWLAARLDLNVVAAMAADDFDILVGLDAHNSRIRRSRA